MRCFISPFSVIVPLVFALPVTAQAPEYRAQILGPGVVINDMNEVGAVVGWALPNGVQAFVASPDDYVILPLPSGYASAWAQGINDAGLIVGSAAVGSFPESGQAVVWTPDLAGGYNVQLLGQLPQHTRSIAYDINNRGDIVGESIPAGSQGGETVWFNSPSGALALGPLGAPSGPKEINDEGVLVGISGDLFDIDTLQGIPLPPFPPNQNGFQGWAINRHGELAGTGIHGSKRSASRWTQAGGWQVLVGPVDFSAPVQAFDINDSGLTVLESPAPRAYFEGLGMFSYESLLVPPQAGQWSFIHQFGEAVNNAGQIAGLGTDHGSNTSGVVLLTPIEHCPPPVNYCTAKTNSQSNVPMLGWSGTSSASAGGFEITVSNAVPGKAGILLYSENGPAAIPFLGGYLCIAPPLHRMDVTILDGTGAASYPIAITQAMVGTQRWYEFWHRDGPHPDGTGAGLTDGLEVTFCE